MFNYTHIHIHARAHAHRVTKYCSAIDNILPPRNCNVKKI